MPFIRLSKEQIESLEQKTKDAFDSFKSAVESGEKKDYISAKKKYDAVYSVLYKISGKNNFLCWDRKKDNRAKLLDKYITQYAIGFNASYTLAFQYPYNEVTKGLSLIKKNIKVAKENMKNANNKDIGYLTLAGDAEVLAKADEINLVISTLEEQYNLKPPKPTV